MKKFLIIALLLIPSLVSAYQDGANWAYGTLTAGIAIDASSMTVTSGTYSSAFPTTNFSVVIFSSTCSTPSICAAREIVLVSSRSGTTFNITRAQEGTTAAVWAAGSKVWSVITEARLDELQETAGSYTAADIANVPAGAIAGDDVQEALNELDTEKVATTDVIPLATGGTGEALVDPDASTLIGWDDTDGAVKFITIGSGLTYTAATDTLSISGATTGDVVGPAGDVATDNGVVRFHLTTGEIIQESLATLDDNGSFNIPAGETYNIDGSAHGHAGTEITFTPVGTIAATDAETAIAEVATDAAVASSLTSGQLDIARLPACAAQYQMLVCDASLELQLTDVFPLDTLDDSAVTFIDDGDNTKQLAFQVSGVTTATTRTLTVPDRDGTIALERPYEVIKVASATLSLVEVGGTLISNYGETDDADLILTLPDLDDYPGANFIYRISTAMATNDTCVKAAADNAFMLGGSAGADNGCICNAGPTLGDKLTCASWTTAAGAVVIDCEATRGTWAIVADNTGDCPN